MADTQNRKYSKEDLDSLLHSFEVYLSSPDEVENKDILQENNPDFKNVHNDLFEESVLQAQKDIQDTLMEPLSYETLKPDSEDIKSALNEAKTNMGKEQYNTRLDILNKIKQSEEHQPQHSEASQSEVKAEPQKKMSLLEKLAAMSPEEDAEELKKYEEGLTVADFMKEDKKKSKREKVEKTEKREKHQEPVENIKEDSDDEDQEDSKLVTILNYVIIVFIVIFIVLAFFIAKQLFF